MLELLNTILTAITCDPMIHTQDKNIDTKIEKKRQLVRKFDNMSEYELDIYLKDKDLYDYYKEYTRQGKITKLVDRMMYHS